MKQFISVQTKIRAVSVNACGNYNFVFGECKNFDTHLCMRKVSFFMRSLLLEVNNVSYSEFNTQEFISLIRYHQIGIRYILSDSNPKQIISFSECMDVLQTILSVKLEQNNKHFDTIQMHCQLLTYYYFFKHLFYIIFSTKNDLKIFFFQNILRPKIVFSRQISTFTLNLWVR